MVYMENFHDYIVADFMNTHLYRGADTNTLSVLIESLWDKWVNHRVKKINQFITYSIYIFCISNLCQPVSFSPISICSVSRVEYGLCANICIKLSTLWWWCPFTCANQSDGVLRATSNNSVNKWHVIWGGNVTKIPIRISYLIRILLTVALLTNSHRWGQRWESWFWLGFHLLPARKINKSNTRLL